MSTHECPFCANLARPDWPSEQELVWRFPTGVAILGQWQYYQGYCVLVHREHHTELGQLSLEERRAFLDDLITLAEAVARAFRPRKLNYELLGNLVPHLHWHVFPRYDADPDRLRPVWLAIDRAEHDASWRETLTTSPLPRVEVVARLQAALRGLGAANP